MSATNGRDSRIDFRSDSRTNHKTLTMILLAALVVVILNTWLAFRSIQVLVNSEYWVQHTLEVIGEVERIMGSAKDAETGNRGYLITGDERYLAPYTTATRELPGELERFGALIEDNRSQQARLLDFREVLDDRLGLLAKGIEQRRSGASREEIHLLVLSGTGKAEMDHLRRIADDMESEERRLLVIRESDVQRNSSQAHWTIGVASALDLVLLVLMFRYLARERVMRLDMERVAAELTAAKSATEAKSAEVQLLNRELEERVRRRTAELETTNRELEAFSYSVSHDLRAPLRTIDGFSLAIEEDYGNVVDAVGKDYIRRVRTSVQRMGQLIDALLQLSRITRTELARENFDMSEVARSVVTEFEAGTEAAKAVHPTPMEDPAEGRAEILKDLRTEGHTGARQVEFRIAEGPEAYGDPKLLRVALENLIGNAVKFSAKVPQPVVEVGWDGKEAAWYVRDNGAGFDMFYADKLFNAFHRLHGDKDFLGSGIGLATVARVVRRHHGKIWADSAVGRGATFWFTLG